VIPITECCGFSFYNPHIFRFEACPCSAQACSSRAQSPLSPSYSCAWERWVVLPFQARCPCAGMAAQARVFRIRMWTSASLKSVSRAGKRSRRGSEQSPSTRLPGFSGVAGWSLPGEWLGGARPCRSPTRRTTVVCGTGATVTHLLSSTTKVSLPSSAGSITILWHQLVAYMRDSHLPRASETVTIVSSKKSDSSLILSSSGFQLRAANKKDSLTIIFPSPVTIRVRSRFRPQALSTPELTCFEMQITDARGGSKRSFESCASAREFLGVLAYLDHLPPSARWIGKPSQ